MIIKILIILNLLCLSQQEPNSGISVYYSPRYYIGHQDFSEGDGWGNYNLYPIMLCDIDGDGKKDLVGFKNGNALATFSSGNKFDDNIITLATGFITGNGISTFEQSPIFCADIDGDKKADFIEIRPSGVYISFSNGRLQAEPLVKLSSQFGWASQDLNPRMVGDIDGDGKADIIGCSDTHVQVAFSNGRQNFELSQNLLYEFGSISGGWTNSQRFPRFVYDINGDGKDDIVGFAYNGLYGALSNGRSPLTLIRYLTQGKYGELQGYGQQNAKPLLVGDINGDKKIDIIDFQTPQIIYALTDGTKFLQQYDYTVKTWMADGTWTSFNKFPRFVGDVNGDGLDDIVGISNTQVVILLTERQCSDITRDSTKNCECMEGYYDNQDNLKCLQCQYPCQSCESQTICKSCVGDSANRHFAPKCICKDGYYDSIDYFCKPCSHPCNKCIITPNNCLECVLQPNRMNSTLQCACQLGYFENAMSKLCEKCNYKCSKCNQQNQCLKCAIGLYRQLIIPHCICSEGYYDDGISINCKQCAMKCKSCHNNAECTECNNSSFQPPNCIEPGFIITSNNNSIQKCNKKCLTCSQTIDQCLQCINQKHRLQNPPLCSCEQGYHDEEGRYDYCLPCRVNCVSCINATSCIICKLERQLNKFTGECECKHGYMEENNNCYKAYKFHQEYVKQCPSNTYQDEQQLLCMTYNLVKQNNTSIIIFSGFTIIAILMIGILIIRYSTLKNNTTYQIQDRAVKL